jgi:hypothetical protein
MKKMILALSLLVSSYSWAMKPSLDPAVKMVEECMKDQQVLYCNDGITDVLKSVDVNARGEFVYYLKDLLNQNENEKVVVNLFEKLKTLVPVYEQLDGDQEWSCRDLKIFVGDISIRFVKFSPIDSAFLIGLYKSQSVQRGREGLLSALHEKATKAVTLNDMDEMIRVAEFAKEHSRVMKDEYYLYESAVSLISKMTLASLKLRPGHEGLYTVTFDDAELTKNLKIDHLSIMESNDRDALVVNFISSQSRIVNFAFKSSGLLGNRFFSNQDVYNSDTLAIAAPFFMFDLNRETKTIKGVFSSVRYGKLTFTGRLVESNITVYSQENVKTVSLLQLVGQHKVRVGTYDMTKRTAERVMFEAALLNDNAMITFSKVSLDAATGILSIVDWKNERKLTLGVIDANGTLVLKGQYLNSPQGKVLAIESI